jgi:hypothetical protein
MTATEKRLEKAEAAVEAREAKGGIEWQMGYVQRLPVDYAGERHTVIVSRLPNGYYEWEERPGPGPVDYDGDAATLIRVIFVKGRDGVKVPYKLGAWREPEEARTQPEVVAAPEQQQSAGKQDDAPGDPLARIRALLAAPPPPPPQTQSRFRPSPAPPPWSYA